MHVYEAHYLIDELLELLQKHLDLVKLVSLVLHEVEVERREGNRGAAQVAHVVVVFYKLINN